MSVRLWRSMLAMSPASASEAIGRLMGDMQNVTGGMPFMAGADSTQMDQKTATGVSIVTTLAQRRLQSKKQNFTWALGRIVEQQMSLMQQFLRRETLLPRVGPDGTAIFEQDLRNARRVTLEAWQNRPLKEKATEKAASLLHLQL